MTIYCQHQSCKKDAVAELWWMGTRLHRDDIHQEAVDLQRNPHATVRCRRIPRDRQTPFYEKGASDGALPRSPGA